MAQFPVLTAQGILEAINFLLSGPSGIGQNFDGFYSTVPTYATGNYVSPYVTPNYAIPSSVYTLPGTTLYIKNSDLLAAGFTSPNQLLNYELYGFNIPDNTILVSVGTMDANGWPFTLNNSPYDTFVGETIYYSLPVQLYTNFISLATATQLNSYTNKFTYTTTYSTPPLLLNQPIVVESVTDYRYNGSYTAVVATSTTGFTAESFNSFPTLSSSTGGQIFWNTNYPVQTDCVVNATTTSPTDRVVLSCKLESLITIDNSDAYAQYFPIIFMVNRYIVNVNNVYTLDKTVLQEYIYYNVPSGGGTVTIDKTYPGIIDTPDIGTYQYRIEIDCSRQPFAFTKYIRLNNRSLTVQVVKQ